MQTTFTTANGSRVSLSIRTEISNMVDRHVMEPCWDMVVSVAGKIDDDTDVELVEHPQHGPCLKGFQLGGGPMGGPFLIPVPAEALDAVREVVAAYIAKIERDVAELVAGSERDARHVAKLRSVRGSAFDPNIIAAERRA